MSRLIAIFSFVFIWSTVNGVTRCPFPGRTAYTYFTNESISWPSFQEGDSVQYECHENWWPVKRDNYSLTCQSDGSWNGPLPVCGNLIFTCFT